MRPVLEYPSTIWNPVYKYDIIKLEAVQRRFLKRLDGLHSLSDVQDGKVGFGKLVQ